MWHGLCSMNHAWTIVVILAGTPGPLGTINPDCFSVTTPNNTDHENDVEK